MNGPMNGVMDRMVEWTRPCAPATGTNAAGQVSIAGKDAYDANNFIVPPENADTARITGCGGGALLVRLQKP